jgi:hypothetical protein
MSRMKWLSLLVTSTTLSACIREYRPPTENEPHAILKVRRTYERIGGTSLNETLDIDENRALTAGVSSALGREARTDAVLVHPVPAVARIETGFFHLEMRTVQETYYEQVPVQEMESYDCSSGFGTNRSYRSCTRMATHYKSQPKQRTVTKNVPVSDGSCGAAVRLNPAIGKSYLLEYTYRDHGSCSLTCFEQIPAGDGSFTNAPCPAAPAPRE